MDVDLELQEVRERPAETTGLVSDADKDLNDVEASVDEKTW